MNGCCSQEFSHSLLAKGESPVAVESLFVKKITEETVFETQISYTYIKPKRGDKLRWSAESGLFLNKITFRLQSFLQMPIKATKSVEIVKYKDTREKFP